MLANGVVRGTAYCPANPEQINDTLWNWTVSGTTGYHVLGYAFTFANTPRVNSTNWNYKLTPQAIKFGQIYLPPPNPSERPLIADVTISEPSQNSPVPAYQNNYNWTKINGGWPNHRTSHLLNRATPIGGNSSMLDGHAEWRKFKYPMLPRTDPASGSPPSGGKWMADLDKPLRSNVWMVLGDWAGLTQQAEKLLRGAQSVNLANVANGGERISLRGQPGYRSKLQSAKVLERLPDNPRGPQHQS
jgi:hypothetical protein